MKEFSGLNASIAGVSPDSIESHGRFIAKHGLGITLLCDVDHSVMKSYGVWQKKKMYGKEMLGVVRTTFLIDPGGTVRHFWRNVKVAGHAGAVLEKLKELRGGA